MSRNYFEIKHFPIVPTVSAQLENKYGRNFEVKNIRQIILPLMCMDFLHTTKHFEMSRKLTQNILLIR